LGLRDFGRIERTLSRLDWLLDQDLRQRVTAGGATGRKTFSKVLIIVAAEADGKRIERIRMALIKDFDRNIHRFIQDNVELESTVCTDGLNSYRELNGYIHHRKVKTFDREASLCFLAFTWSFLC
jgi:hypothetical protein